MRLDDDALEYLWWRDADMTFDPTGSTVVLEVDGTPRAMTWQGSPVQVGSGSSAKWVQTARTNMKFAGSAVSVTNPDIQLTVGRHMAQPIVTTADGQKVPGPEFPIDVK